ncbi:MAG: hypothetical protein K0S71_859 [Clostridia bacterium]|jgi:AraC-like DNA-binding protein|nr:hypothetical protein [Clostridia bacterium]
MIDNRSNEEILDYLRSIDLSTISVLNSKHFDQTSNKWVFTEHSHTYMEMIYFLKGKAHINVGASSINTSIYDVIVYLPGQMHREEVDLTKDQEIICMGIDMKCSLPTPQSTFKLCDRLGVLRWLFEQINTEYGSKNKVSPDLSKLYAQAIILQFIKYLDINELSGEIEALERIQNYIQQNLSSPITPPQLAAMCNISKSYLHRLFKKHLKTTPTYYINYTRISAAKSLLLATDYPIKSIADSIGFDDVAYFSRVFKKFTGVTPSAFRESKE